MPTTLIPASNWPPCGAAYDVLGPIALGQPQRATIVPQGPKTNIQNLYEIRFPGTMVTRYVDNPIGPIPNNDRLMISDGVNPNAGPDVYVTAALNNLGGVTYTVGSGMIPAGSPALKRRLPILIAALTVLASAANETAAQTPVRQWYVEAPPSQPGELGLDRRLIGVPAAATFIVPEGAYYFVGFKDAAVYIRCFPGSFMPADDSPVCFQAIRSKEDWKRPGRHLLLNFIQQPGSVQQFGLPVHEALVRTITGPDGGTTIYVEPRP